MIVQIADPSPQRTPARQARTAAGHAAVPRPMTTGPGPGGRDPRPPLRSCTAGSGHAASGEQRARGTARWTAADVIEAVASSGDDAAAITRTVTGWAAGPHLRLTGGTGPNYPSFTVEADTGRTGGSRWRGALALHASPHGGPPALEVRAKAMCQTPPYNRQHRSMMTAGTARPGVSRGSTARRTCPACGRKSRSAS